MNKISPSNQRRKAMRRRNDHWKFWTWLATRLPRRLAYFAAIRVIVYSTSGKWGKTVIPSVAAMTVLERFRNSFYDEKEKKL